MYTILATWMLTVEKQVKDSESPYYGHLPGHALHAPTRVEAFTSRKTTYVWGSFVRALLVPISMS